MVDDLIALIIAIVVVGIIVGIVLYLVDMIPMDPRFQHLAKMLIILAAVLIIILKALPLLHIAI